MATNALALYSTASPNAVSTALTSNMPRASAPMRQRSRTSAGAAARAAGLRSFTAISPALRGGQLLEHGASMLVVVEHVVAGTGRRQQHHVARVRELPRGVDDFVERRSEASQRHRALEIG